MSYIDAGSGLVLGVPVISKIKPDGSGGQLLSIPVTNGGSGYLVPPLLTITSNNGFGAKAIAVISGGVVVSIAIILAGGGYLSLSVSVTNGTLGINGVNNTNNWNGSLTALGITSKVINADSFSIPMTVSLKSADATRKIELSTDGGIEFFSFPYDVTSATMIVLIVKAGLTHIRFTGLTTDLYGVC